MSEFDEKILKLFTEREVLCEVTDMVEYIFDSGTLENCPPFTPDDVEMNTEIFCPECGAEENHLLPHLVDADEVEPIFDIEGLPSEQYLCPICMTAHPVPEDAKQCCAGLEVYKCTECNKVITMEEYDEMSDVDTGRIFNWFMVTPWLAEKLRLVGEPVITDPPIWGRRKVSKDVWRDSAIEVICSDLQILHGQTHDWSSKMKNL